jgi:5'-phosphate synthase pdxT subunit
MVKIGVLAVQGAFREHREHLEAIEGVEAVLVRTAEDLASVHGLILPGGESTAMIRLIKDTPLYSVLKERIQEGLPTWGTCAGLILLAREVDGQLGFLQVMDIHVKRNAYGSQLSSFVVDKTIEVVHGEPKKCIFIRAPYIESSGSAVEILGTHEGHIIAAKQGNIFVTTFHPELTSDHAYHNYFMECIRNRDI